MREGVRAVEHDHVEGASPDDGFDHNRPAQLVGLRWDVGQRVRDPKRRPGQAGRRGPALHEVLVGEQVRRLEAQPGQAEVGAQVAGHRNAQLEGGEDAVQLPLTEDPHRGTPDLLDVLDVVHQMHVDVGAVTLPVPGLGDHRNVADLGCVQ